jgi:hypothetical protein
MDIRKILNPKCSSYALFLYFLKLRYGFDSGHWRNNYYCRKYKKLVVEELNSLPIERIAVDLGGGLGEIVGRLKTKENILIDLDKQVLIASQNLPFLRITKRIRGSWRELKEQTSQNIDLLITVGWIHGISPEELIRNFKETLKVKSIKFLLVDSLLKPWQGAYKHDFQFLEETGYRLLKRFSDGGENIREFLIFEKISY